MGFTGTFLGIGCCGAGGAGFCGVGSVAMTPSFGSGQVTVPPKLSMNDTWSQTRNLTCLLSHFMPAFNANLCANAMMCSGVCMVFSSSEVFSQMMFVLLHHYVDKCC